MTTQHIDKELLMRRVPMGLIVCILIAGVPSAEGMSEASWILRRWPWWNAACPLKSKSSRS